MVPAARLDLPGAIDDADDADHTDHTDDSDDSDDTDDADKPHWANHLWRLVLEQAVLHTAVVRAAAGSDTTDCANHPDDADNAYGSDRSDDTDDTHCARAHRSRHRPGLIGGRGADGLPREPGEDGRRP
jgi:hypothetical protein